LILSFPNLGVLGADWLVGRTVDECIYLFCVLEKICHQQLLVEAAAANGMPKSIIAPEDAAYTRESNGYWETVYNNVSISIIGSLGISDN
jgi:ribulose-5-phosphate 4-epimerase/fuculose-1-phosphate aldolase